MAYLKKMWAVEDRNRGPLTSEDFDISKVKYYQVVKIGEKRVTCKEWSAKKLDSPENTVIYTKDSPTGKRKEFRVVGFISQEFTYFSPGLGCKRGAEDFQKKASPGSWSIHPKERDGWD